MPDQSRSVTCIAPYYFSFPAHRILKARLHTHRSSRSAEALLSMRSGVQFEAAQVFPEPSKGTVPVQATLARCKSIATQAEVAYE